MLFGLLALALGKTKAVSYTQHTKCGLWERIQNVTNQARPRFMGCLKAPCDTNCITALQGKLYAFVKVLPEKTPSYSGNRLKLLQQIHLGDKTVTKLLLGAPSSWWWNGWNEAISDWRTPSILIGGWDHRTTEYPTLEETHKGHWNPTSGPAQHF